MNCCDCFRTLDYFTSTLYSGMNILVVIIIITLFHEDDIFDTNASLTYDPQLQYL